nr:hypothetical protein [Actinomycetota bacterium]
PPRWHIPRAGSGSTLVYYSHRDKDAFEGGGDEITERVIRRVAGGRTVRLFRVDNPPLAFLDVDRGRIAIANGLAGEIRLPDASVAASFNFPGSSIAVALDGSTLAAHIWSPSSRFFALFNASSGKLLARVRVSRGATSMSAGGGWVVYREGRSIRGFKARTRSVRLHIRTKRDPVGFSVAGRRVAWAENHRGHGRIRAFTLPR